MQPCTRNEYLTSFSSTQILQTNSFGGCLVVGFELSPTSITVLPAKTKETLKNSCFSATSKQQALGLFFKNINLLYIREEPLLIYIHVYVASTTLFQLLLRQDDTRSQCKFIPQIVLLARVLNNEQTFAGP